MSDARPSGFAESAVQVIERQEWLVPLEEGLQRAVSAAFQAGGAAGRAVKNFLHGTWLGHPLHPVLTDVPIGAWTTALVFDALDARGRRWPWRSVLQRRADDAIVLGIVGAVGAALAGLTDWQHTGGTARRTGFAHATLNTLALGLYVGSLAMRRRGARRAGRSLAGAGFGVLLASAYLGGRLVYREHIGVDHAQRDEPNGFARAVREADLREGQPVRADVGGVQVEVSAVDGRQPHPARTEDSQDVAVGEERDVAGDALDALDQPARAHAHLLDGLTLRNRCRPDRPVRLLLANGLGRDALVNPVVPLVQVLGHLGAVAQARQPARLLRAPHGAREDEHELVAGEIAAEGLGLLLAAWRQRDVGPAGVLAALAPLGLPMPDQPHPSHDHPFRLLWGPRMAPKPPAFGRPGAAVTPSISISLSLFPRPGGILPHSSGPPLPGSELHASMPSRTLSTIRVPPRGVQRNP